VKKLIILCFLLLTVLFVQVGYASPGYEDFLPPNYDETDTGGVITVTTNRMAWHDYLHTYTGRINKSYGPGHFGDFEHWFDIYFSDIEAGDGLNHWLLVVYSLDAGEGNYLQIAARENGAVDDEWTPGVKARDEGVLVVSDFGTPIDIAEYPNVYVVLNRTDDDVAVDMYSTSTLRTIGAGGDLYSHFDATGTAHAFNNVIFGIDGAGTADNWSDGHIEKFTLAPLPYWTITFNRTDGGLFRVDCTTMANETEIEYGNGTILELSALPKNSSWFFTNYTWSGGSATTNPYNFTVLSNSTVWLTFVDPPFGKLGVGPSPLPYVAIAGFLIFSSAFLFLFWRKKR